MQHAYLALLTHSMNGEIIISTEKLKQELQLNIFIPYILNKAAKVFIQNSDGSVLKKSTLNQGHNKIDISVWEQTALVVKIETANETILRKIDIVK